MSTKEAVSEGADLSVTHPLSAGLSLLRAPLLLQMEGCPPESLEHPWLDPSTDTLAG